MRFVGDAGMTLFAHASSEQRRVVLERGAHERLVREEHDDELGRARKLSPVRLLAQLLHVLAHVPRVIREERAALVVGHVLAERVEVGDERHLRVDDDVLVAREGGR